MTPSTVRLAILTRSYAASGFWLWVVTHCPVPPKLAVGKPSPRPEGISWTVQLPDWSGTSVSRKLRCHGGPKRATNFSALKAALYCGGYQLSLGAGGGGAGGWAPVNQSWGKTIGPAP